MANNVLHKGFVDILREKNLSHYIKEQPFELLDCKGLDTKLYDAVIEIIKKRLRCLIVGDPDVDGILAAKMWYRLFNIFNYTVDVYKFKSRIHGITSEIVKEVIADYDVVIIVDSSTNSLEKLNKMASYGKKVIVIDHHVPDYKYSDYHENVLLLNTKMINPLWEMSAGAFIGMLIYKFLYINKREEQAREFVLLGAITVYSDSCRIDKVNLSILQFAQKFRSFSTPYETTPFMSEYSCFNRNFLIYSFNNRLNACIKENKFELINRFMVDDIDVTGIEKVYRESKDYVDGVIAKAKPTLFNSGGANNILFLNLTELNEDYYRIVNYTGAVANDFASKTFKLVVSIVSSKEGRIKGSVRDPQQRNILEIFKNYVDAGGHASAFGFFFNIFQLPDFKRYLKNINVILENRENQDIIMTEPERHDVALMADFNEFSHINAMFKIKIDHRAVIRKYEKYITIKWGDYFIRSFKPVAMNDIVYVKPTLGKKNTEYLVNSVEVGI